MEFTESFDSCAKRETLEETGLDIGHVQFLATTNDFMPEIGKHYVTVFVGATIVGEKKEPVVSFRGLK
jgi:8-oxo-dGTP diphosphatase